MSGRTWEDSREKRAEKKRRENVSLVKFSVLKREGDDVLTSKKNMPKYCAMRSQDAKLAQAHDDGKFFLPRLFCGKSDLNANLPCVPVSDVTL